MIGKLKGLFESKTFLDYIEIDHKYYKYETTCYIREATGIIGRAFSSKYLSMDSKGVLTISRGYRWNGASGPTIDTPNSIYPSLIHDALYQALREKLLTKKEWYIPVHESILIVQDYLQERADRIFLRLLKEYGMWWPRRRVWYRAVRWQGYKSSYPKDLL